MILDRNIDPSANIDPRKISGGLGNPLRRDAKFIFVDGVNGVDANKGTSVRNAKGTIAGAYALATAGVGDTIYVMPGHTETITNATTLLLNKAGVNIIGIGKGFQRPTITLNTANTANIPVSAKGNLLQNLIFVGNFLSIASVFTITGTANAADTIIEDCEFRDVDSSHGFLSIFTTNATATAADGLTFRRNKVISHSTSAGPAVVMLCTNDRVAINDNYINHDGATNNIAMVMNSGALVSSNLEIARNKLFSNNTDSATGGFILVTSSTTSTGMVYDNYVKGLDTAAAVLITGTGSKLGEFNNLYTGDVDTAGYVLPAIGTN